MSSLPARWIRSVLALSAVLAVLPALAHDVPASAALIDIRHADVGIELRLPLGELASALRWEPSPAADAVVPEHEVELRQYIGERVHLSTDDGRAFKIAIDTIGTEHSRNPNWRDNDWIIVRLHAEPPPGAGLQRLRFEDSLIAHRVISHQALVYLRRDVALALLGDQPQLLGVLGFGATSVDIERANASLWHGVRALFAAGLRHIAEGADHLCFLLALMLPAPLLARGRRWAQPARPRAACGNLLRAVSGFTLGHSLTLALVGLGVWMPPSRPVETGIALTVLLSALHAIRPLFASREWRVAALFGLVHGLAFGGAIAIHGDDAWGTTLSVLCFNLGIEAAQLLMVAAVFPWLLLWSRSPAYARFRVVLAGLLAMTATIWALARAAGGEDPSAPAIEWIRAHALLGLPPLIVSALVAQRSRIAAGFRAPLHSGPL